MIAILSPAKNLRRAGWNGILSTRPQFPEETARLAAEMKERSPWELESLLKINPEIAMRTFLDYQSFEPAGNGYPAVLSYHGLAYQSMSPESFSPEDFAFAGEQLRILSALYGVLRPCDGIQPYRLEFQCKVRCEGKDLYRYWGDKLCRSLFRDTDTVINLASGEYSRAVLPWLRPGERVITCEFQVNRKGKRVVLPTLAKMARGRMVRYMVRNRISRPEDLRRFEWEGLEYVRELSGETQYVFLRKD